MSCTGDDSKLWLHRHFVKNFYITHNEARRRTVQHGFVQLGATVSGDAGVGGKCRNWRTMPLPLPSDTKDLHTHTQIHTHNASFTHTQQSTTNVLEETPLSSCMPSLIITNNLLFCVWSLCEMCICDVQCVNTGKCKSVCVCISV